MLKYSKIIFLISLVIFLIIRCSYQHFNTENIEKDYIGKNEILNFIGLVLFGVIVPIFAHLLCPWANYTVSQGLQIAGVVLLITSLILFQKTHADLDKQFSHTLRIKKNHKLITTGTYSYTRHPMYSLAFLMLISNALLMPNYISVLSTIGAMLTLIIYRIPDEEKMLLNAFGKEYEEYQKTTCKLIPEICHYI